jgi:hypothetical protein
VNQISTQALVRGGDTLVIGGQVVRKRVNSAAGLPLIGDIPFLGALTRTKSDEYEQYVRIYVVRPRLLGDGTVELNEPVNAERTDPLVNRTVGRVPDLIRGSGLSPRGLDVDRPTAPGIGTDAHFVVPVPRPEPVMPQGQGEPDTPSEAPLIRPPRPGTEPLQR